MIGQHEHLLTQTTAEWRVPEPSSSESTQPVTTDTDEVIILGNNSVDTEGDTEGEIKIDSLFDRMFDTYVATLNDPSVMTEVVVRHDSMGEPVVQQIDHNTIAREQLKSIQEYVQGSLVSGQLEIPLDQLKGAGNVSFATLCDAYIRHGIALAEQRRQASQPSHISTMDTDPDPETTGTFAGMVSRAKIFGAYTLALLNDGLHRHSGPVSVQPHHTDA